MKRHLALLFAGLVGLGTLTPTASQASTVIIVHDHHRHHHHHHHHVWVSSHYVYRSHVRVFIPGHYIVQ